MEIKIMYTFSEFDLTQSMVSDISLNIPFVQHKLY